MLGATHTVFALVDTPASFTLFDRNTNASGTVQGSVVAVEHGGAGARTTLRSPDIAVTGHVQERTEHAHAISQVSVRPLQQQRTKTKDEAFYRQQVSPKKAAQIDTRARNVQRQPRNVRRSPPQQRPKEPWAPSAITRDNGTVLYSRYGNAYCARHLTRWHQLSKRLLRESDVTEHLGAVEEMQVVHHHHKVAAHYLPSSTNERTNDDAKNGRDETRTQTASIPSKRSRREAGWVGW